MRQSARKIWAVVAVKSLAAAKTRLAACLESGARRDLALAMAQDVWDTLLASRAFDGIIVVTADRHVAALAEAAGCRVLREAADLGLNAAVQAGVHHPEIGCEDAVAFIPGDAPFLTAPIAAKLAGQCLSRLAADPGYEAVIAPCAWGTGTNFLAATKGRFPTPMFGPGSFAVHNARSRSAVLTDAAIGQDIDSAADLAVLRARWASAGPATAAWIAAHPPGDRETAAMLALDDRQLRAAGRLRDAAFGDQVTFSKKIFIPLTRLCRDSCHYCTFAKSPRQVTAAFMEIAEVIALVDQGKRLGCKEVLLTLGERPELRYTAARNWLDERGHASSVDYVQAVAAQIVERTGLLPHINMGVLDSDEFARLKTVSASAGAMMEVLSDRLAAKGGPHHGSPDKQPAALLAMLEAAGQAGVPFTTGLLVGIGETRAERVLTLRRIAESHRRHGHVQEVIIQNFAPKPGTRMAAHPKPLVEELAWTVSMARLLMPAEVALQSPPNLNAGRLAALIDAGINDWGGVSPLTPDHVNPEMPWPQIEALRSETAAAGKQLSERLTVYPRFIAAADRWVDPGMIAAVRRLADGRRLAREDGWLTGQSQAPAGMPRAGSSRTRIAELLDELESVGPERLGTEDLAELFASEDADFHRLVQLADDRRAEQVGDQVTFVVNRNINYTNICSFRCGFCAFSKGNRKHPGNDAPYRMDLEEIARRSAEAVARGASEVCLQGGIHPAFDGETYLSICRAVKRQQPDLHIHAFSPLEVRHGATTLGLSPREFLRELKAAGLGSLPGTAAEILHDPVRAVICPDKLSTAEWLEVIESAHEVGLPTTSTIMFGHVESYLDWAIHLEVLRDLQRRTAGLTEFVPLPFVAAEAPMFLKGAARAGPTYREAILMHAVARLYLGADIRNIQASWVKMGPQGAQACLSAGANDLGGVLMNESITRAAGASHGQELSADRLAQIALSAGRISARRTTLYRKFQDLEVA